MSENNVVFGAFSFAVDVKVSLSKIRVAVSKINDK